MNGFHSKKFYVNSIDTIILKFIQIILRVFYKFVYL